MKSIRMRLVAYYASLGIVVSLLSGLLVFAQYQDHIQKGIHRNL